MTTPQQRIGSGFGPRTTADEVLEGRDLHGSLALVTGGYSGIGLETTRALTKAGARVVVPARRPDVAASALEGLDGVEVDALDLGDLESVRAFADRFLATARPLDLVIASAGIMACPETRVGPGWEAQLATNHLGHYALVNRLWPAIVAGGGRVVSVSSRAADATSGMHWDDLQLEHGYDKWAAYSQAKTANVLFAAQLDLLAQDKGVRAFSLHPGGILTPLQRHLPRAEMVAAGWVDDDGNPVNDSFKSPAQGAATQVWAATAPALSGLGGVYCEDVDIADPSPSNTVDLEAPGSSPLSEQAERLWSVSAALTGLDAFAR